MLSGISGVGWYFKRTVKEPSKTTLVTKFLPYVSLGATGLDHARGKKIAASLLVLVLVLVLLPLSPASDTVLYSLGMSGPRYEPWAMHSLPRPFDERRPLGLVQYMPDNTTDWYPNQDVGELKLVNGRIVGHEEVENATAGDENATVSETDEAQETVDGEQTEAEESGEGEEVQGEEEQTEEGDGGEPAATKATRTMLKEKATGAYKVLDPADWLKHKMTSTMAAMKKSIKTTNANKRRIPDPIEWMESRYLKHAHGAKVLAGHASGVSSQMRRRQRVIGGHKLHTSKLSQLKSLALKVGRAFESVAEADSLGRAGKVQDGKQEIRASRLAACKDTRVQGDPLPC
eukprot:750648-Hanusia_phi.AAC.3